MDPEAKSTAEWDGVIVQSPRYISSGTTVGSRDWIFLCKWGSGGLPEEFTKKRMQMVHSETILADGVPFLFSLEFYLCISKFGHKSDMSTWIGIWTQEVFPS